MWYKGLEGGEEGLVVDDLGESMDHTTVFGEEEAAPCLDTEGSVLVVSLFLPVEREGKLDS